MATKTKKTAAMQPVEKLTGTIHGESFTVVLDDINLGDIWSTAVLPKLQKDGIGHVALKEGETSFEFRDGFKSTIKFVAFQGNLKINGFEIFVEPQEAITSEESEGEAE